MPSVRAGLRWTAFLLALVAQAGCSGRAGHPGRITTGYISHVVCSYVFVSGLDPARVNEEDIAGNPVFRGVNWAVHQEVDRTRREVRVRVLGGFESRAVYRDNDEYTCNLRIRHSRIASASHSPKAADRITAAL